MGAIKMGILTTFAIGLLVIAASLSFLAIGLLAVSQVIVELGVAISPGRKNDK